MPSELVPLSENLEVTLTELGLTTEEIAHLKSIRVNVGTAAESRQLAQEAIRDAMRVFSEKMKRTLEQGNRPDLRHIDALLRAAIVVSGLSAPKVSVNVQIRPRVRPSGKNSARTD